MPWWQLQQGGLFPTLGPVQELGMPNYMTSEAMQPRYSYDSEFSSLLTSYGAIAVECKDGKEVLKRAEALLKAPHSAERILRCWGAGMDTTFAHARQYIANLLQVPTIHNLFNLKEAPSPLPRMDRCTAPQPPFSITHVSFLIWAMPHSQNGSTLFLSDGFLSQIPQPRIESSCLPLGCQTSYPKICQPQEGWSGHSAQRPW